MRLLWVSLGERCCEIVDASGVRNFVVKLLERLQYEIVGEAVVACFCRRR